MSKGLLTKNELTASLIEAIQRLLDKNKEELEVLKNIWIM